MTSPWTKKREAVSRVWLELSIIRKHGRFSASALHGIQSIRVRVTADAVVTLPSGVDGAVQRIELSYELRGLLEKISSYNAASGGTVVNEVQNAYNNFWQLQTQYQEHGGTVNTSTSPSVGYGFADGSANTIRPTSLTYPNGKTLYYGYGSGGGADDLLSRVTALTFGSDLVAQYNFLGLGAPVIVDYPTPAVQYTLATGSGTGLYAGLDRFGRVIDCRWQTTGGSPSDIARLKYGHDLAGNRKWREDTVAKAQSTPKYLDEYYTNDALYRLTGLDRGQLTGTPPSGVSSENFKQTWDLDPTGNFEGFTEAATGSNRHARPDADSQPGQRDHRHYQHHRRRLGSTRL